MAYVDDFEFDVFISYAHLDNQLEWVTAFHRFLEVRLSELLGVKPVIWRDENEISGLDYFDEHILGKLNSSAMFISVLSPPYIKSDWCKKEYQNFLLGSGNGARIGNKSRVCKVIKTPVELDLHPAEIREVLGYPFFEIDDKRNAKTLVADPRHDSGFFDVLNDLANDIHSCLDSLALNKPASVKKNDLGKKSVYLAETSPDLAGKRIKIQRELRQRGFDVLPRQGLPKDIDTFNEVVYACLSKSDLSVHILGKQHSFVPAGERRSSAELQLHVAKEFNISGLQSLIWLPGDIDPTAITDSRQKKLVDEVRNNPGDAELLEVSLEDVKTSLFDLLYEKKPLISAKPSSDKPYVYLLYDQGDAEFIEPIYDHLFDVEDFDVVRPLLSGKSHDRREDHEETLSQCDAVLIVDGEAGERWVRSKISDLRKAVGQGREKPFNVSTLYLGTPQSKYKEEFRNKFLDQVIKHFGPIVPSVLADFVQSARSQSVSL